MASVAKNAKSWQTSENATWSSFVTLTTDQIEAVKQGEPVHLVPEEVGEEVVLLRGDVYERITELFDDWDLRLMRRQMTEVMREDWDDPALSVYDQ